MPIDRRQIRTACLSLALSGAALLGVVPAAGAQTLDLSFRPPEIAFDPICIGRPSDEVTVALWSGWDRRALPRMDPALIKRDINRLIHIDAAEYYELAETMITRLADAEPSFRGQNELLSRISLMQSAGRYESLTKAQLVQQLVSYDDGLSARSKNALSGYFRDGIGVPRDVARADALLVAAGYAGNADALLTLSKMVMDGQAPADWDVPLDLAVTMAFGALVGELNPSICDRTARIAREYHSGDVVTRDAQLAHDWFRFTADLGDDYAAWKVVEYHLQAEGFQKDNEILLTYLTQAADAGYSYAQIELGRIYEVGSLVERDLDRALALYQAAAHGGERPGLTRVALFLERHGAAYGHLDDLRIEMLTRLTELDDAPGWAFTRLAREILGAQGRWAGIAQARPLLEQAVLRDDMDGMTELAALLLADPQTPEDFDRAVNLLARTVSIHGAVSPLTTLHAAQVCLAPNAPRLDEAAYWAGLEDATATKNLEYSAQELIALTPEATPLAFATLQSHALYGRPKALAGWLKLLEVSDFSDAEMRAFWGDYSDQFAQVIGALADIELALARNDDQREAALGLLREEYQTAGADAALSLASAIIDSQQGQAASETAVDVIQEALTLLDATARQGRGEAMVLLASLTPGEEARRAIHDRYREVIARNGDFAALTFALPFVAPEARAAHLTRTVGVMPCDYKNVMTLTQTLLQMGEAEAASHWLTVAEALVGRNAWAMTNLARVKLTLHGVEVAPEAARLLSAAHTMGDAAAGRELFQLLVTAETDVHDPARAATMIAEAVTQQRYELLAGYLGRYRRADAATRQVIDAELDMPTVYRVAADSGDVHAMRSYGKYLKETAVSAADLQASTMWLERAAENGDTAAMAEYGEALAFGIGVDANRERAFYWLTLAAEQGSRRAEEITRLVRLTEGG